LTGAGFPVKGHLLIWTMLSLPFQIGFDILLYHINHIYMKRKNNRTGPYGPVYSFLF
jgi:hypothetical protein